MTLVNASTNMGTDIQLTTLAAECLTTLSKPRE